jgi:hypothetical protein
MEKHELTHLETQVKEMCQNLAHLADDTDFQELISIIHRPGWTTVAEAALVKGVIDSMHAQTKTLVGLKQALLTGSRAVTTK